MTATTSNLWTRTQVEDRIKWCIRQSQGAAARLAELLRLDPEADISEQLGFVREAARGFREAQAQIERFSIADLLEESERIDWTPAHG